MKSFIHPLFILGAALYLTITEYWFGNEVPALLADGDELAQCGAFLGTVAWLALTIAFAIWCVIRYVRSTSAK